MKGGTLFSGGGGFCLGMVAAGVDHAWGVEYDDKIAQVARNNGLNTITADILQCDPSTFEPVDFLHASPPCPNFSNAKANAEETENDRALAAKVCQFITKLLPNIFTLENVYQYRNSQSWETIARTLLTHGYKVNYWHVNFANYGGLVRCPMHHALELTQNNALGVEKVLNLVSRMKTGPDIVRASALMQADAQAKILAWDAAAELAQITIQDIADNATPPETVARLLKTKLANLITTGRAENGLTNEVTSKLGVTENILESTELLLKRSLEGNSVLERLFTTSTEIQKITARKISECLLTIQNTSNTITRKPESQMDGDRETHGGSCPLCEFKGIPQTRQRMIAIARRDGITPMLPPATHNKTPTNGLFGRQERWVGWYEAIEDLIPSLPDSEFAPWQLERLPENFNNLLVHGTNSNGITVNKPNDPAAVVVATLGSKAVVPRAFILDSKNQNQQYGKLHRTEIEPALTVVTDGKPSHLPRAFIVGDQNSHDGTAVMNRGEDYTAFTVDTRGAGKVRAYASGRVVKMTVHALARFQTFPDSYRWPASNKIATTIIGNAVPPLFAQRLVEWLL